jgi:acetyl-CoA acetyltransferase
MNSSLECAIVGVGETVFSRDSVRAVPDLIIEAVQIAAADAGLSCQQIDGVVVDDEVAPRYMPPDQLAEALGFERRFSVRAPAAGAGQAISPLLAAHGLASGQADVVVCYCGLDFGRREAGLAAFRYQGEAPDRAAFEYPLGFVGMPVLYAVAAQRYRHLYGLTDEQLGQVAITLRRHGAMHPGSQHPVAPSLDDYLRSPYLAEPLRVMDACVRTTGAAAFIMVSKRRAATLAKPPVIAVGAGFATSRPSRHHQFTQRSEFPHRATRAAAQRAFASTGLAPQDVDFAELQDPYTISVLLGLEDCGFCAIGTAPAFVDRQGIGIDSKLPVNTHGGQQGHAYMLAMTHVIEAVRQLRGEAGARQVGHSRLALVSGFGPGEAGVLLLGS